MENTWRFLYVFGLIFAAEIADKTMLVTIFLVRKYKVWQVLIGIIPACYGVSLLGVGATHFAKGFLSGFWMDIIAGTLFIVLGIWSFKEMNEEDDTEARSWLATFAAPVIAFVEFFIAEMADRTQGATITLSSGHGSFLLYWNATSLGLIAANLGAIIVMTKWGRNIPRKALMYAAGVLFFAFGVYTIPNALGFRVTALIGTVAVCVVGGLIPLYRRTSENAGW